MGKRLGYLIWIIAGAIGIGFNIRDIYQTTRIGLPTQVWTAIAFALFILGTIVVVHYRDEEFQRKLEQSLSRSTPNIALQRRAKLSWNDQIVVQHLGGQMEKMHGHIDAHGIEADYQDGIDTNDILKRSCTQCGNPRNKPGKVI